ncbi:MAG: putative sulfate/molybdate transporter [Bryobacteraceae bacterium]|nr:putative sulfate/molybdate transporter [Bryobacteraceae bacterium]
MPTNAQTVIGEPPARLRFNRQEWSGAFGDMGTDLPLLVGMILAAGLDAASVLTVFGLMQIATALRYRMPMPVQPLKAMAALVIAQKLPAGTLYGGGLAIGIAMLFLTATGLIEWISRVVPKPVVRGIQFGLGLQLAGIALRDYVPGDGAAGWWLAGVGFAMTLLLIGRQRVPAAVVLVGFGIAYAFVFRLNPLTLVEAAGFHLPALRHPSPADVWTGFLALALPQIPLSIANSVLATRQLAEDLFPERRITARRIGWTYSVMNLVNPFMGGVPTCHGSGGMAGHYAFGGRTGGSVIIYGALYLTLGLFFGPGFQTVIQVFPLPVLGVLLLFEAITLLALIRDLSAQKGEFLIAVLVGAIAASVPFGYLVGLLAGLVCYHLSRRGWVRLGA